MDFLFWYVILTRYSNITSREIKGMKYINGREVGIFIMPSVITVNLSPDITSNNNEKKGIIINITE